MKFLSNKALNISNLFYIRRNFNVRDARCNISIFSYLIAGQTLKDLADSYSLIYSILVLFVPTYYSDIQGYTFLDMGYAQVSHHIEPNFKQLLDYVPVYQS